MTQFINHDQQRPHEGIAFYTPAAVFHGRTDAVYARRQAGLDAHFAAHPQCQQTDSSPTLEAVLSIVLSRPGEAPHTDPLAECGGSRGTPPATRLALYVFPVIYLFNYVLIKQQIIDYFNCFVGLRA